MTSTTAERLELALVDSANQVASLQRQHAEIMAASQDSNADDEHDPEGATIAFERQQVLALLTQARVVQQDITAALARWHAGTYGACQTCGEPIAEARLEARPAARTCLVCASIR